MKKMIAFTLLALTFSVHAQAAISFCTFEGIDARAQIDASSKSANSALSIDRKIVPAMHRSCAKASSNRVNERQYNCMHEDQYENRYIVYPRLNQITYKVERASLVVWQGEQVTLYKGSCR